MIREAGLKKVDVNENMRGGDGSVTIEHIIDKDEFYGKGRLFAHIIVKPGCSIGYHVHEGEMETFYVIKGSGLYDDNGTQKQLQCGDVTYTAAGEGHAIANNGTENLELIALIIYK